MANTTYLITGTNKGIGREIVSQLLQRPNTTIVATVRRPNEADSASLRDLPAAQGSKLILVKLADQADFDALVKTLAAEGISALDVVIANAGASSGFKSLLDTTPEDLAFDFEVNTIGPHRLFRALHPVLLKTAKDAGVAKFILVSTIMASIGSIESLGMKQGAAYSTSKASANYLFAKAAVEHKDTGLVIGLLHPGWVQTSLGQGLADLIGVEAPPVTVEESARTSIERVDEWTIEKTGKLINNRGEELPW